MAVSVSFACVRATVCTGEAGKGVEAYQVKILRVLRLPFARELFSLCASTA